MIAYKLEIRPLPAFPSWYPSSTGEIVAIGSNTLDDVVDADLVGKGSHAGDAYEVMANWSGGAIVYKSGIPYLFVRGAGHGSSVNGTYAFGPLTSNTPAWSIEDPASANGDIGNNENYYGDGIPSAVHTYDRLVGVDDSFYLTAFEGTYPGGGGGPAFDRYDAGTGTWDGEGVWNNNLMGADIAGTSIYADGKIWMRGANTTFAAFSYMDPDVGTWTSTDNYVQMNNLPGIAFDSSRSEVMVYTGDGDYYHKIHTSTLVEDDGTTTNSCPEWNTNTIEYDPHRDVFVSPQRGGKNVYEMDPDTLTWSTRTFTGVTPDAGHTENNGAFGRFRYVPELNGYILAPSENGSVYFYRTI